MRAFLAALALLMVCCVWGQNRRKINPVNTNATTTQAINETRNDTARINAQIRARSIHHIDDQGRHVYTDTITGDDWIDSTVISRVPKMEYPLFHSASVSVNLWDPLMRAFGQQYGLLDFAAELNLHNRYIPVFEVGAGMASYRPDADNYHYKSPVSPYFKIGANYNFLFNSNPDYLLFFAFRYGFSNFSYSVDDVKVGSDYWGDPSLMAVPSQRVSAGWLELGLGLRVKIWGPLSAGWTVKFHSMVHTSQAPYGEPWYIPGFGTKGSPLSASISISYTIPLHHLNKPKATDVLPSEGAGSTIGTLPSMNLPNIE